MGTSQFGNSAETAPSSGAAPRYADTSFRSARRANAAPRLVACIDDSDQAQGVSAQALAIACSLGLEVTFARVIEAQGHFASPADPIEWQLRLRTQSEILRQFTDQEEVEVLANSVLLAGAPAEELSDWAQDHGATMLAVGRGRSDQSQGKGVGLGSTAQGLLERAEHSLLLVPPGPPQTGGYRRIMVPIDGSARADSVLPIARRIARTHAADLLLVHIVPRLELVGAASAPHLEQLRAQIDEHNQRSGSQHLEVLRQRSVEEGVKVTAITRGPDDPRSLLRTIAIEEQVDLIVMASHGNTGLEDVACGSVAEYLASHASVPLLIVRPNIKLSFGPEPVSCRDTSVFRFEK